MAFKDTAEMHTGRWAMVEDMQLDRARLPSRQNGNIQARKLFTAGNVFNLSISKQFPWCQGSIEVVPVVLQPP